MREISNQVLLLTLTCVPGRFRSEQPRVIRHQFWGSREKGDILYLYFSPLIMAWLSLSTVMTIVLSAQSILFGF